MIIETFSNNKGQVVGALHHDQAYRTIRQGSKHLFEKMDAWAIDKRIALSLKDKAETIRLKDSETDIVYVTKLDTLFDKGVTKDFGFGEQIFLPRSYWEKVDPNQLSIESEPEV